MTGADGETETYELFYWPFLPGRGEFPRLVLEDAGVDYVDVARLPESEGGGMPALMAMREDAGAAVQPFAPPILRVGDLVIGQTAVICEFLAERHGLAPDSEPGRLAARQLMLTLLDVVDEAHDTHHPLTSALAYEEQEEAAAVAGRAFAGERLPGWLDYLERIASKSDHWLIGDRATYVDLALFQLVEGLDYAFPRAMAAHASRADAVLAIRDRVAARPRLAAYLASERRLPFNEDGIFRRYPALDKPSG